jgi:hypothetical protein
VFLKGGCIHRWHNNCVPLRNLIMKKILIAAFVTGALTAVVILFMQQKMEEKRVDDILF